MEFDPSSRQIGDKYYSSVWSIDATKPLDQPERFERAGISQDVMARLKTIVEQQKIDNP